MPWPNRQACYLRWVKARYGPKPAWSAAPSIWLSAHNSDARVWGRRPQRHCAAPRPLQPPHGWTNGVRFVAWAFCASDLQSLFPWPVYCGPEQIGWCSHAEPGRFRGPQIRGCHDPARKAYWPRLLVAALRHQCKTPSWRRSRQTSGSKLQHLPRIDRAEIFRVHQTVGRVSSPAFGQIPACSAQDRCFGLLNFRGLLLPVY